MSDTTPLLVAWRKAYEALHEVHNAANDLGYEWFAREAQIVSRAFGARVTVIYAIEERAEQYREESNLERKS